MMWRRTLISLAACFALSACNIALKPQDDAIISSAFEEARAGDVEAIEARLHASAKTPDLPELMAQVRGVIETAGGSCTRTFINFREMNGIDANGSYRELTARHQYACSEGYLVTDAQLNASNGGPLLITRFIVTPVDRQAAIEAQSFSFESKGARHYAILISATASIVLMAVALIGAIFTPRFERRWLWIPLSLVGVGGVTFVWPTGELFTNLLSVNLIGFGVARAGDVLSPWIINFTPPIGALIVLSLLWPRWAGLAPKDQPDEAPEPPPERPNEPPLSG